MDSEVSSVTLDIQLSTTFLLNNSSLAIEVLVLRMAEETGVSKRMVKDHTRQESKCDTDRKVSNSCVYLLDRVYIKDVPIASQGSKTDNVHMHYCIQDIEQPLPVDLFLRVGYFHK